MVMDIVQMDHVGRNLPDARYQPACGPFAAQSLAVKQAVSGIMGIDTKAVADPKQPGFRRIHIPAVGDIRLPAALLCRMANSLGNLAGRPPVGSNVKL